jgi:glycosyltransferase involved in cell wall biosynthesis
MVNRIYVQAERYAAKRCDRIISVADAMTRQAVAAGVAGPEKFVTVYSGMEVEPFLAARSRRDELRNRMGFAPTDFVIAKLARLFELKGHDHLLAAAPKVCARHPEARFLLIGDGVLRPQLEAEFSRLGLADRVTFAGLVPAAEVPGYLACSDLLVHASMREGLPRAVPQALLTGTPVVAFDLDGTPEIIRDGQTGLLVRAGDREGLTGAIMKMMEDPALARTTAAAGRALASDIFPAERMVARILDVYEEVLAGRLGPPE